MTTRTKAAMLGVFALAVGAFFGCKKSSNFNSGNTNNATNRLTIEDGVLTIGMEIGFPPFEYFAPDGKTLVGFDIQMIDALAKKLDLKVKLVDTAWDGIFAGVNIGKYDCIISAATMTEERQQVFNFTKPYIENVQVLVLMQGSAVKARAPEEVAGLRVAYQGETSTSAYMAKLAENGLQFTKKEYDKVLNCFDDLRNGRVDVVMCDRVTALYYLSLQDNPFEIVWQGKADETFSICLKKGNNALTTMLDTALNELFADGTLQQISQDIFGEDLVSAVRN